MAVDRNGKTISVGDQVMVIGSVRRVESDNALVIVSGNHAVRVENDQLAKPDDYVQKSAGAFDTVAPSSAVPAAAASTQLVRAIEFDSFANLALLIIAGKADAVHGHDAASIAIDDGEFSGALAEQGISTLQDFVEWVDANWGGGP